MNLQQPREICTQTEGIEHLVTCSQRRVFPKGADLFQTGDDAHSLFYLIRGLVGIRQDQVSTFARDLDKFKDKSLTLRYVTSRHFLGEVDFVLSSQTRNHSAYTLQECEVAEIDLAILRRLVSQHPILLTMIHTQIAQQLTASDQKVLDVKYLEVYHLLRCELITLAKLKGVRCSNGVSIKISMIDLAAKIGCSREMAGRTIKALSQEQFLSRNGYTIVIYDRYL